LENLVLGFQIH